MYKEKTIPDFLSHLSVYRGFPVPYFVPKDENGVFQLKYASPEKMDNCIKYHKCCICFKPLAKEEYFFISGPIGLKTQTDSHPPMHKRCAEYSLEICPHLYFEKADRTSENNQADWQIREKPKEFYLVGARKIEAFKPDQRTLVIRYSQISSMKKFLYKDGILREEL